MNKKIVCLILTAIMCTQNVPAFASTKSPTKSSVEKEIFKGKDEIDMFSNISPTTNVVDLPNKTIEDTNNSNIITEERLKENHINKIESFTNYSNKWLKSTKTLSSKIREDLILEYNNLSNEDKWKLYTTYGVDNPYTVLLSDDLDVYLNKFKFKGIYKSVTNAKDVDILHYKNGKLNPETYKDTIYSSVLLHTLMSKSLSKLSTNPLESLNKALLLTLKDNNNMCKVVVRYRNKLTGEDIIEPTTISHLQTGTFTVKPKKIEGYAPTINEKQLNLSTSDFNSTKEVIFYYDKNLYRELKPVIAKRYNATTGETDPVYKVTIEYIDSDTNKVLDTHDTDYIKKGLDLQCFPNLYTTNIDSLKYLLLDKSLYIPIEEGQTLYKVQAFCKKIAGKIEVECRDEKNKLIQGTTSTYEDLELGKHTITAPKLDKYELLTEPSKTIEITKQRLSHRVIFLYKSKNNKEEKESKVIKGNYKIKFLDKKTNKEIKPPLSYTGLSLPFKNIYYAPIIFGYESLNKVVDISLDKNKSSMEYVMYYFSTKDTSNSNTEIKDKPTDKDKDKDKDITNKEQLGTVYVKYQDSEGKEIATTSVIDKLKLDQPFTVNAREIEGYKLISSNSFNVILSKDNTYTTVYFQYKKNTEISKPKPEPKPEPKPNPKPNTDSNIKYKKYGDKCDSYVVEVKYLALTQFGTADPISSSTLIENVNSTKIDVYSKNIRGYKPSKSVIAIEHNPLLRGETVTFLYIPDDMKVNTDTKPSNETKPNSVTNILIHYRDINGKQLADSKLIKGFDTKKSKYYTATALQFKNYDIIGSYSRTVKISSDVHTNEIAFVYHKKDKENIEDNKNSSNVVPSNPNNKPNNKPNTNPSNNPSNSSSNKPNFNPDTKPSTNPSNANKGDITPSTDTKPNNDNLNTDNYNDNSTKFGDDYTSTPNQELIDTTPMRDISNQTTDKTVKHKPPITYNNHNSKSKTTKSNPVKDSAVEDSKNLSKQPTFVESLEKRKSLKVDNKAKAYSEYVQCNTGGGNIMNSKIEDAKRSETALPNTTNGEDTNNYMKNQVNTIEQTDNNSNKVSNKGQDSSTFNIDELLNGHLVEIGGILLILLVGAIACFKRRQRDR